jgi:hypothetical protein
MTKKKVEEKTQEQIDMERGEAAYKRILRIGKMVYEYEKVLNNDSINSFELMEIGLNTVYAGFMLIKEAFDVDDLTAEERMTSFGAILNQVVESTSSIYLDKDNIAKMVEQNKLRALKNTNLEELVKEAKKVG